MIKNANALNQKRLELARETIRLYGDKIPAQAREGILSQIVLIGMSPYEAKLAGGAFYFKVEADPKCWAENANPHAVMDKQSVAPDDSKIWMTFENGTQFPNEGIQKFIVYFSRGRVLTIDKLSQ